MADDKQQTLTGNEQLISKIRKLLELASSPNENEARLAMDRAQELMAKYSISLIDSPEKEQIVEVEYIPPFENSGMREQLPYITNLIAKIFNCVVIAHGNKPSIIGFESNIKVATYSLDCILNQCWIDFIHRTDKSFNSYFSFWLGVRRALVERFHIMTSNEVGIVVFNQAEDFLKKKYTNLIKDRGSKVSGDILEGYRSGLTAQMRPAVETKLRGNLLK